MQANLLSGLNPQQSAAVTTLKGPLVIVAGAGSGKTTVITRRLAALLDSGIPGQEILAVTFTNRAAAEMRLRVRRLVSSAKGKLPQLATFHAFGLSVIKEFASDLGYRKGVTVFDRADCESVAKDLLLEHAGLVSGVDHPRVLQSLIGAARMQPEGKLAPGVKRAVQLYAERLQAYNAVDFDDLILITANALTEDGPVKETLLGRINYIMVDEFQDTSSQQYQLVARLAEHSRNLCVVGDDDQSIYSWRGAGDYNLERFDGDFPERVEITLEQNYRSTNTILLAANHLISHNTRRKSKKLWSDKGHGTPIEVVILENQEAEGAFIAERVRSLMIHHSLKFEDFGVLVRTNARMRPFEEAFLADGLPYQVSGGMSFFQRKEVKDSLAYLRLMVNPEDDISFLRLVNTPRRGIGPSTVTALGELAQLNHCSLYSALQLAAHKGQGATLDRATAGLGELAELLERYRNRFFQERSAADVYTALMEEIDYPQFLLVEYGNEAGRWKKRNAERLGESLRTYQEDPDHLEVTLSDWVGRMTLHTSDEADAGRGKVNLITMHAAKGLEFPVVFIAGAEDGLMPHARALADGETNIEEERRLFYVGVTRAQQQLFITCPESRKERGKSFECTPTPFLQELPEQLLTTTTTEDEVSDEQGAALFAKLKARLQNGDAE